VRHWRSLEGYAHQVDQLFEALPASSIALDSYVRFLYHVGERSLPAAFVRLAASLRRGNAADMLREPNRRAAVPPARLEIAVVRQHMAFGHAIFDEVVPELADRPVRLLLPEAPQQFAFEPLPYAYRPSWMLPLKLASFKDAQIGHSVQIPMRSISAGVMPTPGAS
jgi:hypothetical protein